MQTLLTIGVPVRNEKESLEKCLQAIMRSDLPESTEIIICDNGSTDKSLDRISKIYIEKIKIVKEPRLGKVFAMNKIIEASGSDYIIFCDADVLVKRDTLKRIYEKLKNTDLHMVGLYLIDISQNKFFNWYYKVLVKIQKDDIKNNVMGGCFGINKNQFVKFPPVLSTDFFMSAYYYYGNGKAVRCDDINAYFKRANTVWDILMKTTRNRMKYLQIKKDFRKLAGFQYEPPLDHRKLYNNLSPSTLFVASFFSIIAVISYIAGTIGFYAKFKNIGYTWRKAKSTKLGDIDMSYFVINEDGSVY